MLTEGRNGLVRPCRADGDDVERRVVAEFAEKSAGGVRRPADAPERSVRAL